MNIWKHSLLSAHKFGGQPEDYYAIHKFIDSSKLFYHHVKHRIILHNLYGTELAIQHFGDYIINKDKTVVLTRDIVAEHCKEDLSGMVPTLYDWLWPAEETISKLVLVPDFSGFPQLNEFIHQPFLNSGLKSAYLITCSDFGVHLANELLGFEAAITLRRELEKNQQIKRYLAPFEFQAKWQYTPSRKDLIWLEQQKNQPVNR